MSFSSTPPASAIKTPINLGLTSHPTNRPKIPSLTIKTANGSCVSILNDCDEEDNISPNADHHKRCLSVPGGCRPFMNSYSQQQSSFRSSSTPGPNTASAMLPSLTTLVQAVGLVTAEDAEASSCPVAVQRRRTTGAVRNHPYDHYHHYPVSVPLTAPVVAAVAAPAATKTLSSSTITAKVTTGKRKYKCTYQGCGKAFTTSGHLARHQRIHTGEKNFACPFPGCTSRFSRQDNMMQHYRTHLSSKSRRNASPRNVMFVDTSGGSYRKSAGAYNQPAMVAAAPQVYAGSHPIQHHQQLHPFSAPNAHHHHQHPPMISSSSSSGHNSHSHNHNHLTSHPASSATGYHSAVPRDSSQQQFPR